VAIGLAITGLSLLHMAHFNLQIDFTTAVSAWAYSRLGMAFLFTPINVMAFYFIPKEKMNNATGLINLARNIGGSVGIANVTTLLARRAQVHQSVLVSHLTPLDPAYSASLSGASRFLMAGGSDPVQALNQAHGLLYGNLIRQASMLAYTDTFWLLGLTFLAMIPFMFLMKKVQLRGPATAPAH
jgi:DHA2 family multidrug resistance protein